MNRSQGPGTSGPQRPSPGIGRMKRVAALALAAAAVAAACGRGAARPAGPTPGAGPGPGAGPTAPAIAADPAGTVWLCRPGATPDPCAGDLTATVVPRSGPEQVEAARPAPDPAFDCFYVYPTVSTENSANSDLAVQTAETATARSQAALFSQVCRVWAPMYRQSTLRSLLAGPAVSDAAHAVAYQSLLAGWTDYLRNFNDGRPVIFIGHSQGAVMLIDLLRHQIDPDPALRARTVLAILAGGNVVVPPGAAVGGAFANLPLCTSAGQAGCVIAYSSFPAQPPADAYFGIPGQGVSRSWGQTGRSGVQVACVNPAAVGSASEAELAPYFTADSSRMRPEPDTPYVTFPGLYGASCRHAGDATWLQVGAPTTAGDGRPVVGALLGAEWGYHVDDINLVLGDLVADASAAETTWTGHHAG